MQDFERYEALGRERLIEGDLFEQPDTIVIPIMTKGRAYGVLSQTVQARGIVIPDVPYVGAEIVKQATKPDIMFLAFWNDEDNLERLAAFEQHVVYCVAGCISSACRFGKVKHLAFPLLGGKRGMQGLAGMALGYELAADDIDTMGWGDVPEVVFVTNKTIIS